MTKRSETSDIDGNNNEPQLLFDGFHYTGNKGPAFGVRHVQVGLMALGLGVGFSYRTMFSAAIIAMTDNTTSSNADVPTYDWSNRSTLISAIFWGTIFFPLVSGYLGNKYGPKWFIMGAGLFDSLMFLLIPFAAKYGGFIGVLVCRLFEGFAQGITITLNTCILGNWVPAEERSKMSFIGTAAITLSIIITSVATGYISESSLGWPWIFYSFGALGITWSILFGFLAEQNPSTHPRITPEERKYIQVSLDQKTENDVSTPWKKILTSIHVWAILVAQIGATWVVLILATEMSIFMTEVMKYGAKSNALISALPALSGIIAGIVVSFLSDYIPKKKILTLLNARRVFQTTGMVGISTCLIVMTFIPVKHSIWAVVLMCVANVFLVSSGIAGAEINTLDVSPKFAGIIFGCYGTISQSVSLIIPFLIQWIVTDESDAIQWRTIFIISAVIAIGTSIFFDVFATATRQNWDAEGDAIIITTKRRSSMLSITGVVIF